MSLRQIGVATLALLGGVNAANSCCFVAQDEAHEVYWVEYATSLYTVAVNLTSITTLLTPYPTTTITNYETNVYPTSKVITTSSLVTENPVALYTNPAAALPQNTEILSASTPTETGGLTIASPTGFWVYSTAKIFAAPAVTDAQGNVACGTLSSFSAVATDPAACVPTFTGINHNAAAMFDNAPGVEITLTTPFIHVPTRAALLLSPTEACAQGNGTENYGYPVQQLIDHLAGNAFYSAQYPGIENCVPAGPSIQAVNALAVAVTAGAASLTLAADPPPSTSVDPPAATDPASSTDPPATSFAPTASDPPAASSSVNMGAVPATSGTSDTTSVETPGGGLTGSTTKIVSPTSTAVTTSTSVAPTTSPTTTSVPTVTVLPESMTTSGPSGIETPISSGGLLPPSTTSSVTTSSSTIVVSPLPETTSSPSSSASTSSSSASSTSSSSSISTSSTSSIPSISSTSSTSSSTSFALPSSTSLPTVLPDMTTPTISIPSATTSNTLSSSVKVNGTTSATGSSTQVPASSSGKVYISWELMASVMGFIFIGLW